MLRSAFKARFPAAVLRGDDADFAAWVAEVLALIEALTADSIFRSTSRARRFSGGCGALRAIPAGPTATYADIAARIGSPSAVRAVAGGLPVANSVAVVVPCHRVVGTDGQLKGYRWGVQRKRALLDREADARARS